MTSSIQALQNEILNTSRKQKLEVTLFLVNGYRMSGKVVSFDQYTVLLNINNKQHLIFKHAISTVIPSRPVDISSEGEELEK